MKEYKRRTVKGRVFGDKVNDSFRELYSKIQDLEDKIEDGTLKFMPCKIGDPAWFVYAAGKHSKIYKTKVRSIEIYDNNEIIIRLADTCRFIAMNSDGCGYAYLDETKAEEKLKELQNGQ